MDQLFLTRTHYSKIKSINCLLKSVKQKLAVAFLIKKNRQFNSMLFRNFVILLILI